MVRHAPDPELDYPPIPNVRPDPETPPPPPPPSPDGRAQPYLVDLTQHLTDPGPLGDMLAAAGQRVAYDPNLRLWLLWQHPDVRQALAGDGWNNRDTLTPIYRPCDDAMAILMRLDVPATTAAGDGDEWRRGRAALDATMPRTPDEVRDRWGDIIRFRVGQVAELVAKARWGTVDLVADCADLLPLWTICDALGVPGSDIDHIKAWGDGQCRLVWDPTTPDAEQVRLAQGLLDFWQWTQAFVAERVESGRYGDDLTGELLAYRAGDDRRLSEREVASLVFNLLVAGHETTAGLIAHALEAALTEPGVWDALVANPDRVGAHVTRTLRCAPPIDGWLRTATRDHHYGDVTIPAGARALLLIGAANRHGGRPLSFGHGRHHCPGDALAHTEAVALLRALVERTPRLRISPAWRPENKASVAFRAPKSLVATVG